MRYPQVSELRRNSRQKNNQELMDSSSKEHKSQTWDTGEKTWSLVHTRRNAETNLLNKFGSF